MLSVVLGDDDALGGTDEATRREVALSASVEEIGGELA